MSMDLLNTLVENGTTEQIDRAYFALIGRESGPYKGERGRTIRFYLSDECNKVAYGFWSTQRWDMLSDNQVATVRDIIRRTCDALIQAGISLEKGDDQKQTEAAFAACGGWLSNV